MKKLIYVVIFFINVALAGCVSTKTTYIEILKPDRVFYGGELAYRVEPGDTLKVTRSQTCRGGNDTCWVVWDVEKKKKGAVLKRRMEENHRVYVKEE